MALVVAAAVAGCSGPTQTARLRQAESAFQVAKANPDVQKYASGDLFKAQYALDAAQRASRERESEGQVDYLAYLAEQRSAIAVANADAGANRAQIDELGRQGPEIQLQAERQKNAALLQELSARQSFRGTVVTLGDALFESGEATLKPGPQPQLSRLADYLRDNPNATVTIEGHTDSVGSAAANQALSTHRAYAVRRALIAAGVDPSRITARGLGDAFPIASNSTAAGQQQNRRVEVAIQ
jgi:outer membrane protein OmpA-like peptidoglycan-associated protein